MPFVRERVICVGMKLSHRGGGAGYERQLAEDEERLKKSPYVDFVVVRSHEMDEADLVVS